MSNTTNTNEARTIIQDHIIDCMALEDMERYARNVEKTNGALNWYLGGKQAVEYGCLLVYYEDQREFICRITGENPEVTKEKYSNDRVFDLYCHLIGREFERAYKRKRGIK